MTGSKRLWIPRPNLREAYEWAGRLDDLPAGWRASGRFIVSRDNTLVIDSDNGLCRAPVGAFAAEDLAGQFYRSLRPAWLTGYADVQTLTDQQRHQMAEQYVQLLETTP